MSTHPQMARRRMPGMPLLANLRDDLTALAIGLTAPYRVDYGKSLYFSGTDLPRPRSLRVPTRHGRVRCEIYRPDVPSGGPAYVHLHGGAFLMRFPKMDDFFCRLIAAEVGAVVVNVDYDVAPRARFPVAQEQAHDVAAWLAEHPEPLSIDPTRIAIGGFSAGGNLAASACLQARDLGSFRPAFQLLGVPSLNVAEPGEAKTSPLAQPMLDPRILALVRSTYFRDPSSRSSPYASPLLADSVEELPPTLVITAELDLLRAEGDAYADRLRAAGVPVEHLVVPGADHYFLDGHRERARGTLDHIVASMLANLPGVPGPARRNV